MAKNDCVLLDGVIEERIREEFPSSDQGEVFEYLAAEQILKDLDLTSEEIISGIVDGRQDGGIDSFYILVNGHLLQEVDGFQWPKTGVELRVYIITSKHHKTFKEDTVTKIVATLGEILDFSVDEKNLKGAYSRELLNLRQLLFYAYRRLSSKLITFSLDVLYASRGDTSDIGKEVLSRADQVTGLINKCFTGCNASFSFIGSSELVEMYRKAPNYELELPFIEHFSDNGSYVILTKISDYYKFVSEDGKLRRYLFDSNVRDFMGLNRVNEDIRATLENANSPDFWWLNNGVTILATKASIAGKTITACDVQIINGLQTTESIFRHFEGRPDLINDKRCVLVKIFVFDQVDIRDSIIRATNNQTNVELSSLHATDKIQRDIEDIMSRNGLFYERRKNLYINQGHSLSEIITPLYVAGAFIGLVLKSPERAASLKSRFMRSQKSYEYVFSSDVNLGIWPKLAKIMKAIDVSLEKIRVRAKRKDKFLKGWRYIISLLILAENTKKFDFSINDIIAFDEGTISYDLVFRLWSELLSYNASADLNAGWKSQLEIVRACKAHAAKYGISGVEVLLKNNALDIRFDPMLKSSSTEVSDQFVDKVLSVLPPQPWKTGMRDPVISQLGCSSSELNSAIDKLIETGRLYNQKNGVLYDLEGNVISFDIERVDAETLLLKDVG